MKSKLSQIKLLDKILLPIFGIKSVTDYKSKISLRSLKRDKELINKLNKKLNKIKKIFPVREFNLHKSDNKIKTYTQAYGILKKCLQLANIQFEIIQEKRISKLRLIPKNLILENYINTKNMSDIRENYDIDFINISDNKFKKQMDSETKITKFNIDNMPKNSIIAIIAKKGSGKTTLVNDILSRYDNKFMSNSLIISPAEKYNENYKKLFPNTEVLTEYNNDKIKEYLNKTPGAVVLDDALDNKGKWINDSVIMDLFYYAKDLNKLFIIIMQFPLGIKPELRSKFDYVFLLAENFISNQKRLYDHYAGMFPDFESFQKIFKELTKNYNLMVIDQIINSNIISDKVFTYKARVHNKDGKAYEPSIGNYEVITTKGFINPNIESVLQYEDLQNAVKSFKEHEYIYPLSRILNNMKITFGEQFHSMNMEKMGIKFISKKINEVDIISQDMIDEHLNNQRFEIYLHDKKIHEGIINESNSFEGMNILSGFKDKRPLLLPFSNNFYTNLTIIIYFQNSMIEAIKNAIDLKIEISEPIFKKSINDLLLKSSASNLMRTVNVPFSEDSVLVFVNNSVTREKTFKTPPKDWVETDDGTKVLDMRLDPNDDNYHMNRLINVIEKEKYKKNGLIYFYARDEFIHNIGGSTSCLYALCRWCNVAFHNRKTNPNIKYYEIEDDKLYFEYTFNRESDTIRDLIIESQQISNDIELSLEYHFINPKFHKEYRLDYERDDFGIIKIVSNEENKIRYLYPGNNTEYSNMLIVGKKKSGKTDFVIDILKNKSKEFIKNSLIICINDDLDKYDKKFPDIKIVNDFDEEIIEEYLKNKTGAIIFDDLPIDFKNKSIKKLIMNNKKMVIITSQDLIALSPDLRMQFDYVAVNFSILKENEYLLNNYNDEKDILKELDDYTFVIMDIDSLKEKNSKEINMDLESNTYIPHMYIYNKEKNFYFLEDDEINLVGPIGGTKLIFKLDKDKYIDKIDKILDDIRLRYKNVFYDVKQRRLLGTRYKGYQQNRLNIF